MPLYSSDVAYPEYQEAFFYYLFGAVEMDCFGIIDFAQEKCVLFVPKLDNFYKIWMTTLSIDEWKVRYPLIDEIHYTDEMEAYFAERKPATIFLNKGVNSDSGLTTQYPEEKHYAGANACLLYTSPSPRDRG